MDSFHLPPTTFEIINVRYINNLSKGKFLEAFYLGFPTLLKHTQINIVKVMLLDTFQSIYLIKSMFMFIHKHCNKYLLDVFFFRIFVLWKTIYILHQFQKKNVIDSNPRLLFYVCGMQYGVKYLFN